VRARKREREIVRVRVRVLCVCACVCVSVCVHISYILHKDRDSMIYDGDGEQGRLLRLFRYLFLRERKKSVLAVQNCSSVERGEMGRATNLVLKYLTVGTKKSKV
jgi:hypothetical protein